MKQVFLTAPTQVEIRESQNPTCPDDGLLVKIAYCGICTLEQRLFSGDRKIYYPIVPGHEASGVIVEVGKNVHTHHKSGDHVALDLVNRCHVCHACLTGNSNLCENRFKKGQKVLGGFSQYMVVKPEQAVVVSAELDLKEAALTEPLSCCIRSLKKLNVKLGDDVLVFGAGTMGMLHLLAANAMGARVIVSDIDDGRLELAKKAGAAVVINGRDSEKVIEEVKALTSGHGVDAVAVTTPAVSVLKTAFDAICSDGRINIYTSYNDKPQMPTSAEDIHRTEAVITGSEGRTEEDFYQASRVLSSGKIKVAQLISKVYSIDEAQEALQIAGNGKNFRVLLETN